MHGLFFLTGRALREDGEGILLRNMPKMHAGSFDASQKPHAAIERTRQPRSSEESRFSPGARMANDSYWTEVRRELTQHWPNPGALAIATSRHPNLTSVADVLHEIAESVQPLSQASGREVELEASGRDADCVLDNDLRAAIRALLESSLGRGSGPVRVVSRLDEETCGNRSILIEVRADIVDVADTVRRKLSKAVIAHAGQTSFISARIGSSVRIRLPVAETTASSSRFYSDPESRPSRATRENSEYIPRF